MSDNRKVLVINATPAKVGGAKSIIEKFISTADFSSYDQVYLLSPEVVCVDSKKVKRICFETSGIYSVLFSTIFVLFYAIKFRATHLISFNNVNLIFPFFRKVTYYHTPHIFYSNNLRHKVLRLIISKFMKGQKFVFQSSYVLEEFKRTFGGKYEMVVNWCGCDIPGLRHTAANRGQPNHSKLKCIVPIMNSRSKVKNFEFILNKLKVFQAHNIQLVALDDSGDYAEHISYIGRQSKSDLFKVYDECDFMLMPSLFETVGLPIFEFAATGKPVLVLDKPYIHGIDDSVGLTKNIIIFGENDFEKKISYMIKNYDSCCVKRLSKNHPLVKPNWNGLLSS